MQPDVKKIERCYYTVDEVATILGVSPQTVNSWCYQKAFKSILSIPAGSRTRHFIPKEILDRPLVEIRRLLEMQP